MDDAYESTLGLSVHSLITIIWKEKKKYRAYSKDEEWITLWIADPKNALSRLSYGQTVIELHSIIPASLPILCNPDMNI